MWRLNIADGGNDPYIFSTNNFVGRQIWEFDPDYGTPEERAQAEANHENFRKNRFKVKASSDLLWQIQVISSLFEYYTSTYKHIHLWKVGGEKEQEENSERGKENSEG